MWRTHPSPPFWLLPWQHTRTAAAACLPPACWPLPRYPHRRCLALLTTTRWYAGTWRLHPGAQLGGGRPLATRHGLWPARTNFIHTTRRRFCISKTQQRFGFPIPPPTSGHYRAGGDMCLSPVILVPSTSQPGSTWPLLCLPSTFSSYIIMVAFGCLL